MSEDNLSFPVRFRGYDRDAVDWELRELRTALDHAQAERDRAVGRALAVENRDQAGTPTSTTVQWLIDTAEEDARRIREEARQAAAEYTERADELLRHRVELIEQAQREADVCRAEAAEEARRVVREALEKADALLSGLRESEAELRRMFESGDLTHHMPPPRSPSEEGKPVMAGAHAQQHPAVPRTDTQSAVLGQEVTGPDGTRAGAHHHPADLGGHHTTSPAAGMFSTQTPGVPPSAPSDVAHKTVASEDSFNNAL